MVTSAMNAGPYGASIPYEPRRRGVTCLLIRKAPRRSIGAVAPDLDARPERPIVGCIAVRAGARLEQEPRVLQRFESQLERLRRADGAVALGIERALEQDLAVRAVVLEHHLERGAVAAVLVVRLGQD